MAAASRGEAVEAATSSNLSWMDLTEIGLGRYGYASSVGAAERDLARRWGEAARQLLRRGELDSNAQEEAERQRQAAVIRELDLQRERCTLQLDAIALVTNARARDKLKRERDLELIRSDFATLARIEAEREQGYEELWQAFQSRQVSSLEKAHEGGAVLAHLAELLHKQSERLVERAQGRSAALIAELGGTLQPFAAAVEEPLAAVAAAPSAALRDEQPAQVQAVAPVEAAAAAAPPYSPATLQCGGGSGRIELEGLAVVNDDRPSAHPSWLRVRASVPAQPCRRPESLVRGAMATLRGLETRLSSATALRRGDVLHVIHTAVELAETLNGRMAPPAADVAAAPLSEAHVEAELERHGYFLALNDTVRATEAAEGAPRAGKSLHSCRDVDSLSALAQQVIDESRVRVQSQGRLYLEASVQSSSEWILGLASEALQRSGLFGGGEVHAWLASGSLGLTSAGRALWGGRQVDAVSGLSSAFVVGLLIDLHVGAMSAFVDGQARGTVFGLGSELFGPEECRAQAAAVRGGLLFFSASLQGVHAPTTRRSSLLRSPSHTGQTSGSQLPPASSASASSAPSSPAAVAPGSAAGVSVSVPRQHVAAAPRILVNFGALPFLSAAPASAAYDHQQPPDLARVAEEAARVTDSFVVALASSHAGARKPGAEDGAEAEAAATAAESAPVTVRFEERAAERVPELPSDRAGYTRLLLPRVAHSWSNFPPHSLRVKLSVLIIQRSVRVFLGRRRRRRLRAKFSAAVLRIQRAYRRWRERFRAKYLLPAVLVQRLFRGLRCRRVYRVCREFRVHPVAAHAAATKIQAAFRGALARRAACAHAVLLSQQIEYVHDIVRLVQHTWRLKLMRKRRGLGAAAAQPSKRFAVVAMLTVSSILRNIRLKNRLHAVHYSYAQQVQPISGIVAEGAAPAGRSVKRVVSQFLRDRRQLVDQVVEAAAVSGRHARGPSAESAQAAAAKSLQLAPPRQP